MKTDGFDKTEYEQLFEWFYQSMGLSLDGIMREIQSLMEDGGKALEKAVLFDKSKSERRKKARERARIIERRYRAEIRRTERERICRHVRKPHKSKNRRNRHGAGKGDCNFAILSGHSEKHKTERAGNQVD